MINVQDILKGAIPVLSIADYVTGGSTGSPTFLDIGAVTAPEFDIEKKGKEIETDSSLHPLDIFMISQTLKGKFQINEADLAKLAKAIGDPDSAVTTVAQVPGTTDGTMTYSLDEQDAMRYFQLKLVVDNQSLTPVSGGDTYTKHTIVLWKVVMQPKIKLAYKKADWFHYEINFDALYDSTAKANGDGAIGYIENWMSK